MRWRCGWSTKHVRSVQAVVRQGPLFFEAPTVALWEYARDESARNDGGARTRPDMYIRSEQYGADEFFEIQGTRGFIWVTRLCGNLHDLPPVVLYEEDGRRTSFAELDAVLRQLVQARAGTSSTRCSRVRTRSCVREPRSRRCSSPLRSTRASNTRAPVDPSRSTVRSHPKDGRPTARSSSTTSRRWSLAKLSVPRGSNPAPGAERPGHEVVRRPEGAAAHHNFGARRMTSCACCHERSSVSLTLSRTLSTVSSAFSLTELDALVDLAFTLQVVVVGDVTDRFLRATFDVVCFFTHGGTSVLSTVLFHGEAVTKPDYASRVCRRSRSWPSVRRAVATRASG